MAQALPSENYTQFLNLPAPPVGMVSPVQPLWVAFPRSCHQQRGAWVRRWGTSQQQQLLEPTAAQRSWAGLVMEELCNAPQQRKARSVTGNSSFGKLFLFFPPSLPLLIKGLSAAATANNKTKCT